MTSSNYLLKLKGEIAIKHLIMITKYCSHFYLVYFSFNIFRQERGILNTVTPKNIWPKFQKNIYKHKAYVMNVTNVLKIFSLFSHSRHCKRHDACANVSEKIICISPESEKHCVDKNSKYTECATLFLDRF